MAARAETAAPALCAFAAVAATGFANGGYFPTEWGWTLLGAALVALLAVLVRDRLALGRPEAAALAALAAFAGWTALSAAWSVSAAQPVLAAERTAVYAAALAAAALVATSRLRAPMQLAGVLAAATIVCAYALATRLAPGWVAQYPPPNGYALEEPIGYSNAVGLLAAIGALLSLLLLPDARSNRLRGLVAAPLPLLAATLYLTFSRGAWLALVVGVGAALALAGDRLHVLGVLLACLPPSAAAVLLLHRSSPLTHEGAPLAAVRTAGWHQALSIAACVAAAAGIGLVLGRLERSLRLGERMRRRISVALTSLAALVVAGLLIGGGGPLVIGRHVVDSFVKQAPDTGMNLNHGLISLSGDVRGDYWRVAAEEISAHPWLGGGAGSYERYWHAERTVGYEARNAHNLYLETLAELGPVGLALLLAFVGAVVVTAVKARRRPFVPAATAGFVAYAVHAAVDWDFQILSVTLAGVLCGAAVLVVAREREAVAPARAVRTGAAVALAALAAAAIAVQIGNSTLAKAQTALDNGDLGRAQRLARRAHRWQPWSYEPWQLLGESALAAGDFEGARRSLRRALALDGSNWSLWYDLAEVSRGPARRAAASQVRRLNPRGPQSLPTG